MIDEKHTEEGHQQEGEIQAKDTENWVTKPVEYDGREVYNIWWVAVIQKTENEVAIEQLASRVEDAYWTSPSRLAADIVLERISKLMNAHSRAQRLIHKVIQWIDKVSEEQWVDPERFWQVKDWLDEIESSSLLRASDEGNLLKRWKELEAMLGIHKKQWMVRSPVKSILDDWHDIY